MEYVCGGGTHVCGNMKKLKGEEKKKKEKKKKKKKNLKTGEAERGKESGFVLEDETWRNYN